MKRYLSLLLIVGLLAIIVTAAIAQEGKEEDEAEKEATLAATTGYGDGEVHHESQHAPPVLPGEEQGELIQQPVAVDAEKNYDFDMGPCEDASKHPYVEANELIQRKDFKVNVDYAIVNEKATRNNVLQLVTVDRVAKRPGCGMYYFMTMNVKSGTADKVLDCLYFTSNYSSHLEYCNPHRKLEGADIQEGTDVNKCQEPIRNKYEEVPDPNRATFYANLAALEYNMGDGDVIQLDKVIKAKKRPGCGMYYRIIMTLKDKAGVNGIYECEVTFGVGMAKPYILYFRNIGL